jgi:hypothetical protein
MNSSSRDILASRTCRACRVRFRGNIEILEINVVAWMPF